MNKLKSRDVYNANEYSVNLDKSNIEKALEEQKAKVKVEKPKPEFNANDFLDTRLKYQTKPGTPSSSGQFGYFELTRNIGTRKVMFQLLF